MDNDDSTGKSVQQNDEKKKLTDEDLKSLNLVEDSFGPLAGEFVELEGEWEKIGFDQSKAFQVAGPGPGPGCACSGSAAPVGTGACSASCSAPGPSPAPGSK